MWFLVRAFRVWSGVFVVFGEAFCEACSPLPMGEGPGVRSGFGEAFRVLLSISWVLVGISCLANRLALETSCLIRQSIRQNVSSGEGIFHPDVLG